MSRFSKAKAVKLGWHFVHEVDEETLFAGGQQGVTKVKPASVRAEKYVSLPGQGTQLVNEEAQSMGLLLERIHAYEQHLAGGPLPGSPEREEPKQLAAEGAEAAAPQARDEDGNPILEEA